MASVECRGSVSGTDSEKASSFRWVIPAVLFVVVTISFLDRLNISVLIADPAFLSTFGIAGDTVRMGMLMTAFLLAYGFSNFLLSPLGDIFGPRYVLSGAVILWGLAMLAGCYTSSFVLLLASRAVLGVGEGLHWPMQSTYCKNWFPQRELGRANSIWLVGAKVGPVVAVPLFTWVITTWGWRASFEVMALASVAMFGLVWFLAPDNPERSRFVNQAELRHIRESKTLSRESPEEKRAAFKRDYKALLKNPDFWVLTAAYICQCCIFWGMLTWLPSYLKTARGFSWAALGGYTALTWISAAAMTVFVGYVSDKLGRRGPFIILGLTGAGLGILASALIQDNVHAAWAIICAVCLSGSSMASIWASVPKIVPKVAISSGSGIMNGCSMIVSAFIPTIIGYCISLTGGYTMGLISLVAIGGLGGLCGVVLTIRKH